MERRKQRDIRAAIWGIAVFAFVLIIAFSLYGCTKNITVETMIGTWRELNVEGNPGDWIVFTDRMVADSVGVYICETPIISTLTNREEKRTSLYKISYDSEGYHIEVNRDVGHGGRDNLKLDVHKDMTGKLYLSDGIKKYYKEQ